MKKLILLSMFVMSSVFAGVEGYVGTAGEKLYIEEASALGKDTFLVKFTGVESPWADKPIKVLKNATTSNHYKFEYKEELSSGIHTKTYGLVTQEGQTLVAGSIVKKIKLWTPKHGRDGVTFTWDKALTDESQKIDLASDFKKKPFTPEVD